MSAPTTHWEMGATLALAIALGLQARRMHAARELGERLGFWLSTFMLVALAFYMPHFIANLLALLAGGGNHLPLVVAIQCVAGAALHVHQRHQTTAIATRLSPPHLNTRSRVLLGFYLLIGLITLLQRPQGFEATAYHLPTAVHFLNQGNLLPWEPWFPHNFPANVSLLFAPLLALLPEQSLSIANLTFVAVIALTTNHLSKAMGADRWASRWCVMGASTLPMVIHGSIEANSDLGGCAFLLLSCAILLSPPWRHQSLMAGLSLGIAFGFKSLHLIAVLPLLLLFALQARTVRPQEAHELKGAMHWHCLMFALGFLTTAGFWLLRNYVIFGNPLYPVAAPVIGSLLGWPSEPSLDAALRRQMELEWVNSSWQWAIYPWTESQNYGQAHKHSSGLGPFFAAIVIPATLLNGIQILRGKPHPKLAQLTFVAITLLGIWWLLGDRQPRYALGALLLLVAASGAALSNLVGSAKRVVGIVATISIAFMMTETLVIVGAGAASRLVISKQWARSDFYEYPALLDTQPPGTVVMNLGDRPKHYGLFGSRLSNQVISAPAARHLLNLSHEPLAPIPAAAIGQRLLNEHHIEFIYAEGAIVTSPDCPNLKEVWREDLNPVNRVPLAKSRILYQRVPCS